MHIVTLPAKIAILSSVTGEEGLSLFVDLACGDGMKDGPGVVHEFFVMSAGAGSARHRAGSMATCGWGARWNWVSRNVVRGCDYEHFQGALSYGIYDRGERFQGGTYCIELG